jgi:hypothetical protein
MSQNADLEDAEIEEALELNQQKIRCSTKMNAKKIRGGKRWFW